MKTKLPLWKNIAIIVGVLVVLGGAYVGITKLDVDSDKNEAPISTVAPKYTAYQIDSADVASYTIHSEDFDIKVINQGDEIWQINGVDSSQTSKSKLSDLTSTVCTIISNYEITKDISNLAEYGLDNPTIIIEVMTKSGNVDKLLIGNMSPLTGEYFFLKEGDSTIYSIYAYKISTFMNPISYYQSYDRLKIDVEKIDEIILERTGKEKLHLKIKENLDDNTYTVWSMLAPYEGNLNAIDQFIDDKILSEIANLSIQTVAPEGRNYGLNQPQGKITLNSVVYKEDGTIESSESTVITVGNSENGNTYVKLNGENTIYTVPSSSLEFLNVDEFLVVSKLQGLVDIQDTNQVIVTAKDKVTILDISHEPDNKFSFKVNGNEVKESTSKQMYQNLIALPVDDLYKNQPLGEIDTTILFKGYQGTSDVKIEFASINELSYAVNRNGKVQFTIKKSKVKEVLEQLANFEENPMK